uniref:Uncharacterized protein n=1 Tax=Coccidioides posadasii RMSCC 3488 TaxID=454284 RepID=A0A0J6IAH8_COCPO|nr:hypothetical protein CPAG_04953 [Coccidioides posadasii RMSCC 3488]
MGAAKQAATRLLPASTQEPTEARAQGANLIENPEIPIPFWMQEQMHGPRLQTITPSPQKTPSAPERMEPRNVNSIDCLDTKPQARDGAPREARNETFTQWALLCRRGGRRLMAMDTRG